MESDIRMKLKETLWTPPPKGWLKLNVDAAQGKDNNTGGVRAVFKDSAGRMVVAATKVSEDAYDTEITEAQTILCGAQWALEASLTPIIIESDALNVVNLIRGSTTSLNEIDWFVAKIRETIRDPSLFWIQFRPRVCNITAHDLTSIVCKRGVNNFWRDDFPSDIMYIPFRY